jgi:hypothetical protein
MTSSFKPKYELHRKPDMVISPTANDHDGHRILKPCSNIFIEYCEKKRCKSAHFIAALHSGAEAEPKKVLAKMFLKNELGSIIVCENYGACTIIGCRKGHLKSFFGIIMNSVNIAES